jgi:hypothetical protein
LTTFSDLADRKPRVKPSVRGKFFFIGNDKLYVRGATYGTFRPNLDGDAYPEPSTVTDDFAYVAAHGLNTVRTYDVPPRWLLDEAYSARLRVLVGLPGTVHQAVLDEPHQVDEIEAMIGTGITACAGHPAIFEYAIGNEISSSIVRWHGKRRVERYIRRLYHAAKAADPDALITYVNFPSTEYLDLPFLDFVSFNVYLEDRERLESYLARLQALAGARPLIMAEIGLDSRRNGEAVQAQTLEWQIASSVAAGAAGAFVFAWTDEWNRGGYCVTDWDFGLTIRDRFPKLALSTVSRAFAEHISGCNMAFRTSFLRKIGGFDPRFRVAGDDVDVCWRIQEQGWKIAFSPSAVVWHHRRDSVRAYWQQQRGYGRAEAALEQKWPQKYNAVGHLTWSGRLYGAGVTRALFQHSRIYHGSWGSAP